MNATRANERTRTRSLGPAYVPRRRTIVARAAQRIGVAFTRQWPVLAAVAALVCVLGLLGAYLSDPLRPAETWFWASAGVCAGLAATLFREVDRNTITSASSLSKRRGYAVIGAAPELAPAALRCLPPEHRNLLGCLAFAPASAFATAFRDLQGALAGDQVVAFIAASSDDGSSTSAMCAAASAAQQGRRVILVDCDIRHRSLTEALGIEADEGVLEAAFDLDRWRDIISEEPEIGFAFLPAAGGGGRSALSSAPGWKPLLAALRETYDLVVLDCPPALADTDGAALAARAGRIVVVAAWDRTSFSALANTMKALRAQGALKAGVFVNRVPAGNRFGRLRPS